MLSTIEKVLLLQDVEILKSVSTKHLGHVAAITEEVEFQEGDIIYSEGESATSMYVVISGDIRLHRGEQEVMIAKPKTAIGVWALFEEEEERMVTATCLGDTRLLYLEKEDFHDLLADHSAMIRSVLSTMAKKLRGLVGRVSVPRNKEE
jgi:CRP-like cAMP-binding protein